MTGRAHHTGLANLSYMPTTTLYGIRLPASFGSGCSGELDCGRGDHVRYSVNRLHSWAIGHCAKRAQWQVAARSLLKLLFVVIPLARQICDNWIALKGAYTGSSELVTQLERGEAMSNQ